MDKIVHEKEALGLRSYVSRIIYSVVAIFLCGWINNFLNPITTMGSAKMAGEQLKSSDTAYVASQVGMSFFHDLSAIPGLILLVALLVIWWKPLTSLRAKDVASMIIFSIMVACSSHAFAFYEKPDKSEAITIMPDESFFWIPDTGDNKSSQVKLNSEEYYLANKLPVKRFIIPHETFKGSNPFWRDYYVPTGRAIIQPRTPYSREWAKDSHRGSSSKNEAFPCQDNEGHNVTVEVAIGTYVTEDQAPRYLFNFGIKAPKGDRMDPAVIFTSVYYGKDLPEVMDSVVRNKVQTLVCSEVSKRDLDKVNLEADKMLAEIEKNTTSYLEKKGITLDYIGWAGTFEFDPDVQRAINDRYTAKTIAPYLGVLQQKAVLDMMNKWNGTMPTSLSLSWLPSSVSDFVGRWFNKPIEVPKTAEKTEKK